MPDDDTMLGQNLVDVRNEERRHAFAEDAILLNIEQRCLGAVLEGGETWARFKADAERRMGRPWLQIKGMLNERSADRKRAAE